MDEVSRKFARATRKAEVTFPKQYAAKRWSGNKRGDLMARAYTCMTRPEDACIRFAYLPAYSGISLHRWLHRRRTVNAICDVPLRESTRARLATGGFPPPRKCPLNALF